MKIDEKTQQRIAHYVSNQFARPDCFGQGDVIDWVHAQMSTDTPDLLGVCTTSASAEQGRKCGWVQALAYTVPGSSFGKSEGLQKILTRGGYKSEDVKDSLLLCELFPELDKLYWYRNGLSKSGDVYISLGKLLFVTHSGTMCYTIFSTPETNTIQEGVLEPLMVAYSLALNWKFGKGERAEYAKNCLCTFLFREIQKKRDQYTQQYKNTYL